MYIIYLKSLALKNKNCEKKKNKEPRILYSVDNATKEDKKLSFIKNIA